MASLQSAAAGAVSRALSRSLKPGKFKALSGPVAKRTPNAYALFVTEKNEEKKHDATFSSLGFKERSGELSRLWKATEGTPERERFQERAADLKREAAAAAPPAGAADVAQGDVPLGLSLKNEKALGAMVKQLADEAVKELMLELARSAQSAGTAKGAASTYASIGRFVAKPVPKSKAGAVAVTFTPSAALQKELE
jgi:hypothetical protein